MPAHLELPADHPHVAVVTIDRPDHANALDPPTLRQLADAWRRIAADADIRCAVLTGAGERVFCAGMDMKTTIPASQRFARGERVDDETFAGLRSVQTALLAGFDLATPLVCAVNGHARDTALTLAPFPTLRQEGPTLEWPQAPAGPAVPTAAGTPTAAVPPSRIPSNATAARRVGWR